ncbi:hypothetical protein CAPTEDRAFT_128203 [Capitella teleta]|uniref:RING-type domain-containing protein n=1 Tax=Capitella teleta TaxID=283909 RepID=R7VEW5_CAPTE|nr:hypothetical protein CAPTEDRAFT_128203 [Capitella teleta]|eukprot:ELU14846.1 hypothetical protein CAPTEDRAFT_128203 [Capitella teleta]
MWLYTHNYTLCTGCNRQCVTRSPAVVYCACQCIVYFVVVFFHRSHEERRLRVRDVNSHVTCRLCKGYLIDASTIQKCLHSFCRSCLVRFLASNHACPVCGVLLNRSEPLLNVRLDRTLQNLVYKLVPGLFKDEMQRRHHRYFSPKGTAPAGQSSSTSVINPQNYSHIVTEDEKISSFVSFLTSPCLNQYILSQSLHFHRNDLNSQDEKKDCRFLLCPAMATVMHLKKMIRCKFDLAAKFQVCNWLSISTFYHLISHRRIVQYRDEAHV